MPERQSDSQPEDHLETLITLVTLLHVSVLFVQTFVHYTFGPGGFPAFLVYGYTHVFILVLARIVLT